MLSKLKQLGLYIVFILIAVVWLIASSRKAGKRAAEMRQQAKQLDKVKKAHEIEQDIDRLTPDERRERLRKHK